MNFSGIDKKFAVTTTLLTLMVVSTSIGAFQTYQLRNLISNGPAAEAPAPERPKQNGPTKKPSEYKFGVPYEKAVKAKKPMIVLFYADWCGFCIRFMPIYEELYKNHKDHFNFVKVNVEDKKYEDAVNKYQIAAFPTVFMVNTKNDTHEQLKNENFGDMNKLNELLNDFYNQNK